MKIQILNESKQSLGGGWSFIRNFKRAMHEEMDDVEVVESDTLLNPDVYFVASPSMVNRDLVTKAKESGKPVVLRLDNIPRNSRNRGTGTPRMYDIAQMADKIVYQSQWAKDYLMPFIRKDGVIVYNGVDTMVFQKAGAFLDFKKGNDDKKVYLYSRYNRDETKGWEKAWYRFQMIARENPNSKLIIVGQFSDELREYGFDFYMNEDFEYMGVVDDPVYMAQIMRGCDVLLAPYFNDCYSNTIQEAMACGLDIETEQTGGTPELIKNGVKRLDQMAKDYMEVFNELV